ncbi:MAG: hypothetical protein K2W96_06820 [Gemmataceae bacterium]|nr:hypothetical protein [Gemmataceae bacterium]
MERLEVRCLECERGWSLPAGFTVYEQQSMESCPCPYCGACVLSVAEPDEARHARAEGAF